VLTLAAVLDTGPDPASFASSALLEVGGVSIPVADLVPDKKGVLRSRTAQLSFAIVPGAAGSSRCAVTATMKGAEVATLGADATVELTLACGGVAARGACTLTNGAFTLGRGGLWEGASVPRSFKATLGGPRRDAFTLAWVMTPGEPPPQMSDIVVAFGPSYSKTIPGASFKRKGSVYTITDKTNALPSMRIDTATGLIVMTAKKTDLGSFPEGAQSVRLTAGPADDPSVVEVRMVRSGKTLSY
jgi:hypothetical protein